MDANWKRSLEKAQLPRVTMEKFVRRQMIDERVSELSQQHEDRRWEELNAFATTLISTMLWTLHEEEHMGAKKLRHIYEAMIRNRIAYRLFFRDGNDYKEQKTGRNIEDTALFADLRSIGVDLKAWGEEEIRVDETTGEVSFHAKSCDDVH